MSIKLILSALGGIGITSSALAVGILKGSLEIKSSNETATNFASREKPQIKNFKKFSDLNHPIDGSQQCLIFYVSELSDPQDGVHEYEGHQGTFKSKEEAIKQLQGKGLSDNDLEGLFCGSDFRDRKYALTLEEGHWNFVSV
ncbi:hypothetical protein MHF_0200 [Mycoplasma haemofelis Ohio2]|uniref:Uncharacterized protein n=1 Tax=Mycoplasma haemofelis (strain Ohio2) TaxID=859194 RepID=F6FGA9_MYCHI|nr:hypothetical protein MHF_0200 [Mycoplasma haemofelis Ohio2]